jgi:hypothetical protein
MNMLDQNPMPSTEGELTALLIHAGLTRAYADLRAAARQRRLNNHEIGIIERRVIDDVFGNTDFAAAFTTFEAEKSVANARQHLRGLFATLAEQG